MALEAYDDEHLDSLGSILLNRIKKDPMNLVSTLIFFCAILHTFLAGYFRKIAHKLAKINYVHVKRQRRRGHYDKYHGAYVERVCFKAELFHFLGEIEVVFGLWLIPGFLALIYFHGISSSVHYLESVNFIEPMFVVIIMTLAATRPIMQFAEKVLRKIAQLGGGTSAAWWFTILTVGPILGSFITEPAAMTISAIILSKQFYNKRPSLKFSYATIGLLFVNISVGGTLSHFAAPPVLMVSGKWHWDLWFMVSSFGWKALIGILIANTLYFFLFRSEFEELQDGNDYFDPTLKIHWEHRNDNIPLPVTLAHFIFMIWTVCTSHYPPLFIFGFLVYLGFAEATRHHQNAMNLKPALLVGFFLAGLVVHGGAQSWWIAPILGRLSDIPLMLGATVLTAFNDNAAITYLATLVPDLGESLKYAVVAGAVTGGGLTVIANAPNPAGQSILRKHFSNGVSPMGLALAALLPTLIMGIVFMVLP